MTTSAIGWPLRVWFFVELFFAVSATISVAWHPALTASNFAWTIQPEVMAATIGAFYADLVNLGIDDDTVIVVYSEFGRTVYQNGSNGTDHGTVNPVFVLGGAVNGGLIVPHPAMDPGALDEHGELTRSVDFRDVFGTIADRWLGANVAQVFPGHTYGAMNFLP